MVEAHSSLCALILLMRPRDWCERYDAALRTKQLCQVVDRTSAPYGVYWPSLGHQALGAVLQHWDGQAALVRSWCTVLKGAVAQPDVAHKTVLGKTGVYYTNL